MMEMIESPVDVERDRNEEYYKRRDEVGYIRKKI